MSYQFVSTVTPLVTYIFKDYVMHKAGKSVLGNVKEYTYTWKHDQHNYATDNMFCINKHKNRMLTNIM